jgi:predicted transcriptional regulator
MIQPGQVAAVRKRLGISQAELAKRSGVSQSLIAKIESGRLDPAFSKAQAISVALEEINPGIRQRTAAELMNPDLVMLAPSDPVEVAIVSMAKLRINQIPIMNDGIVEGTLTQTSLMDFVVKTRNDPQALRTPVRLLMDDPLPQVRPATEEEDVLILLKTFPAVLVRDKTKTWGIVTKLDIISNRTFIDGRRDKK